MIAALVIVIGALAWPRLARIRTRHIERTTSPLDLCRRVEDAARGLQSGRSLRAALAESLESIGAGPALAGGRPLVPSLEAWVATAHSGAERCVATALVVAAVAGGPQALALDSAAASIRSTLAVEAEARAHAAQARLSAIVIVVLPLAFLALTAAGGGRTVDVLLHTGLGQICLAIGLGLDALGAVWLQHLVRRVTR